MIRRQELKKYILRNGVELHNNPTSKDWVEACKLNSIEDAVKYLQGVNKKFYKYGHVVSCMKSHKEVLSELLRDDCHNMFMAGVNAFEQKEEDSAIDSMIARVERKIDLCMTWIKQQPEYEMTKRIGHF